MYGKIFDSIYNGTLYGQWEALVTMQQLIVLADADGVVDMTPMAISARTSIPREIIDKGLEVLAAPDKYTRTPGSDGRRIELIDDHRPWGWILVNYEKYKGMRDSDTVRAQTRERVRKHRENKKKVKDVTHCNAQKRHIDIDIDIDKTSSLPDELNAEAWKDYLQHRKDLRVKKLTQKGETMAMNKLLPLTPEEQRAVVDNTISNGWTGLFPDRSKRPNGQPVTSTGFGEFDD